MHRVATNLVCLDDYGLVLGRIVCGTAEVVAIGSCFRIAGAVLPYQPVVLPAKYENLYDAVATRNKLNLIPGTDPGATEVSSLAVSC